MPMSDEDLVKLFLLIRRPIVWDPIPPWIRTSRDVAQKFTEAQARWNAKLGTMEQQKLTELGKIVGIEMGR